MMTVLAEAVRTQYSFLNAKEEPRIVPASFDFCLANLNREASSAGTSIPSESLNPAAFLVWGDPSLFDGTVSVLRQVAEGEGLALDVEVIPGVTSVAALAACHHVALHDVGEAVVITTGRRLRADGWPAGARSVVVMADAADTLDGLDDDLRIWWGALVGLPGERLISGRLGNCRDAIHAARADVRAAEGWLFDIYLLRR